ncbi:MAG: class I SAM-dependent rRNA methyltransferase [Bacillota bacterium]|nr:class I SAM-dependent rRNA methyltransferase [Bacillota bacterium]
MAVVRLKRGEERRLRSGHPWIYASEVEEVEGEVRPGEVVEIQNSARHFLGRGYFNPRSRIAVRRLTELDEPIDEAFFRRRLLAARAHRERFCPGETAMRLVFSEGDLLPGLIVDRYGEVLVLQILTLGMERWREVVVGLLVELFQPRSIYEKSDVPARRHEGLEPVRGLLWGEEPGEVVIEDGPLRFRVDVAAGQKTGYFLDQRLNRRLLEPLVRGGRVLDAFTYTGGFAVHAAFYGAREVWGWDVSAEAVDLARRNAALNGVASLCTFEVQNAFDGLRALAEQGPSFDVVILDPPAFAKAGREEALAGAVRGYKEINLRALKILRPGGFLVTASCSHHIAPELFLHIVEEAAADAHCRLRRVALTGQPPDHPVLLGVPETRYLTFAVFEVVERVHRRR